MGTSYRGLREPWSSIEVEYLHTHTRITLWEHGGYAGTLTVQKDWDSEAIASFVERADDLHCPMRTYWGGEDTGTVVVENCPDMPDDRVLVSESGQVVTVGDVRAYAGDGKKKEGDA